MAPGLNTKPFIPNHQVIGALPNGHIAVRTNPGFALILAAPIGRLNGVIDAPAVLGTPITHPEQTDVQLGFIRALLGSARAVTAAHLVPSVIVGMYQGGARRVVPTGDVLYSPTNLRLWVCGPVLTFRSHFGTR